MVRFEEGIRNLIAYRPHGRSFFELPAILSISVSYTVTERTVPRGDELDHR